jgi:uncharacterized protein YcfJ
MSHHSYSSSDSTRRHSATYMRRYSSKYYDRKPIESKRSIILVALAGGILGYKISEGDTLATVAGAALGIIGAKKAKDYKIR